MKRLLLLVCVLGTLCRTDASSAPSATAPNYQLTVVATAPLPERTLYHDGKALAPISIPVRNRSAIYTLAGTPSLTLAHEELAADGVTFTVRPLGKIALPPGGGRYLVILGTRDESGALRGMVFEDGYEKFPPGTVRLQNLSARGLNVRIGGEQTTVAAKTTVLLRPGAAPVGELLPFWISARSLDGARDQRLLASGLEMSASTRVLIFLSPHSEYAEQLSFFILKDTAHVPAANSAPAGPSLARAR